MVFRNINKRNNGSGEALSEPESNATSAVASGVPSELRINFSVFGGEGLSH
jgi:hypothetical protein